MKTETAPNELYTVTPRARRLRLNRAAEMALQNDVPAVDCQGVRYTAVRECGTWGRAVLVAAER